MANPLCEYCGNELDNFDLVLPTPVGVPYICGSCLAKTHAQWLQADPKKLVKYVDWLKERIKEKAMANDEGERITTVGGLKQANKQSDERIRAMSEGATDEAVTEITTDPGDLQVRAKRYEQEMRKQVTQTTPLKAPASLSEEFDEMIHRVKDAIEKGVPGGRARSLALTKLEECGHWLAEALK